MEVQITPESKKLIFDIFFALVLGLIIGLEREHRQKKEMFAGIRTFPLITVLGTMSAFIAENYWEGIYFVTLGGLVIASILNYYLEYPEDIGFTTEVSTYIAYIIGILVFYQYYYVAAVLAVSTTILLALKPTLERFAKGLSREDIIALIKFALITVVIYPILPDKNYGPFGFFNPKHVWEMVIIVSAIDFLAYILLRWKGTNTLWLTGLVGGLVSSTAVSYNFAKLSKRYPNLVYSALFGITLAWTIMNIRVIVLSGFVDINAMESLLPPMIIVSIIYLGLIFYIYKKNQNSILKSSKEEYNIHNPFEISSAIEFGLIYAMVVFGVKALKYYYGNKGIYIASLISGVIDVDAITLSLSSLFKEGNIALEIAVNGILIAVLSNTYFKYFYIGVFGDKKLKKDMLIFVIIMTVIVGLFLIF